MSLYGERLAKLKRESSQIKANLRKGRKLKPNQQIAFDFVHGVTENALFSLGDITVTLKVGDEKKGFMHILLEHYCRGCKGEISTKDILNLSNIIEHGLKLSKHGVTNGALVVYQSFKGQSRHKIVLKPEGDNNFIVTLYSVD